MLRIFIFQYNSVGRSLHFEISFTVITAVTDRVIPVILKIPAAVAR